MKKTIQGAVILLMILMPAMVWSGDIKNESLEKLMIVTGLNGQTEVYAGFVLSGVEGVRAAGAPLSNEDYQYIKKSVETAFSAADIRRIISREIRRNLSESEARELLAWYESDIGKEITKAEVEASMRGDYREILRNAQFLASDQERMKIAEQFDRLTRTTDLVIQVNEDAMTAMYSALESTTIDRDVIEVFKEVILRKKKEIHNQLEELVTVSYVYRYQNVNLETLEKYIRFLEQPTNRKLTKISGKAMKDALKQSAAKMARLLAMKSKNGKR